MNSCMIEKLLWVVALALLFATVIGGNVRTAGMVITIVAAAWYGVICPFVEEIRHGSFRRKGSVH